MIRFQLFRIKIIKPKQIQMFFPSDEPTERILKSIILEKPSAKLHRGFSWHVGNLSVLDQDGFYFALGRTTSSVLGRYDAEKQDFIEQEYETAPYTHVLLDVHLGLCAIAGKSTLAPNPQGIARQLGKLLAATKIAEERKIKIEISEVKDPEDFIIHIQRAYAIRWFSITFTRPNPFDVDKDFQAPMEKLLNEAEGDRGETSISGKNLDAGLLERITRSTAASGNDAKAKIQFEEHQRPVFKQLKGNIVSLEAEDLDSAEIRMGLLDRIRSIYNHIRHIPEGSQGE